MTAHERFMQRALYLAQQGGGTVAPNPMVGAVLVHNGEIIGEGWHQKFGAAHAEVNCINSVQEKDKHKISESTIYVSLEPCAHFGKTPPCAALIIENKIPQVVIACKDPFSKVAGKGMAMLETAEIAVTLGVLEAEAQYLNRRFFTFHQSKRPYIILKWAESKDHYIAPIDGRKHMLSNAYVQRYVHKMRKEEAAILIGFNTARLDNPMLTNRYFGQEQPLRIVLDWENELPSDILLKTDGKNTIIFNTKINAQIENCKYVQLNNTANLNNQVLDYLYQEGINSMIIEGGAKTLHQFLNEGLWDEAHIIATPVILKNGIAAPKLNNAVLHNTITLEDNTINVYQHLSQ